MEDLNYFFGIIGPFLMATGAIVVSLIIAKRIERGNAYSSLDLTYTEIMKMAIEKPEFVNPEKTKQYRDAFKGDELYSYDMFAFMAMNLVATIHDRYKKNIPETWLNVLKLETSLHRNWFDNNKKRLVPSLTEFIEKTINDFNNPEK